MLLSSICKADLMPGFAVRMRDGRTAMVAVYLDGTEVTRTLAYDIPGRVTEGHHWISLTHYNADLTHKMISSCDVMEVYGFSEYGYKSLDSSNPEKCRTLLWKRSEPKKMTVKEICEALGYDVEIVKEGPNA